MQIYIDSVVHGGETINHQFRFTGSDGLDYALDVTLWSNIRQNEIKALMALDEESFYVALDAASFPEKHLDILEKDFAEHIKTLPIAEAIFHTLVHVGGYYSWYLERRPLKTLKRSDIIHTTTYLCKNQNKK